jgi:DNA polymerase-1
MHIPIIEVKGYEADDLIELLKQAEKETTSMVTPDKDFAQLVSKIYSCKTSPNG